MKFILWRAEEMCGPDMSGLCQNTVQWRYYNNAAIKRRRDSWKQYWFLQYVRSDSPSLLLGYVKAEITGQSHKCVSVYRFKHTHALFIHSAILSSLNPSRDERIFASPKTSGPALRPTHIPIRRVPRALSLAVKRPEREANHPPPISGEGRNEGSYFPASLHGA